jgi:hypothetical protein
LESATESPQSFLNRDPAVMARTLALGWNKVRKFTT